MSAPAPAPAPAASCACTNVSIMQLFHELKQQFPTVPDHVVSSTIESHCHDRGACHRRLQQEADTFVAHSYPRRSSTAPPPSEDGDPLSCKRTAPAAVPPPPPKRPDSLPLAAAPASTALPWTATPPLDGYPLNVSVNLDCRVADDEYRSPGQIASVNLTVRTPTSQRRQPDDSPNFRGDVRITLSSGTPARSPRAGPNALESRLIKQRARLERLEFALKVDRERLVNMQREVRALEGPPPSSPAIATLRHSVQRLHVHCQRLTERLDGAVSVQDGGTSRDAETDPLSWRCHVCTYENPPRLNKCDMCNMPRIILVHTDDEVTVHLHPGIGEITRSWIL